MRIYDYVAGVFKLILIKGNLILHKFLEFYKYQKENEI